MLKKSSPLKLLGQMEPTLAGNIYVRSPIKLLLPAKVGSIWPSSFRGGDVLTLANQKQDLLLAAMFIGRMEPNEEAL
jgi:hypothetical protein